MPGIAPERPISASALETLLGCPLAFLYRRVLRWDEPGGAPPLREVDPLSYGGLFHEVMERFYRENGVAFVAREKALGHWRKVAREVADVGLSALLASYPLVGGGIREKERGRLLRDVERFLEYDWRLPALPLRGRRAPVRHARPGGARRGGPSLPRARLRRSDRRGGGPRAPARPQDGARPPPRGRRGGPDARARRPARPVRPRRPQARQGVGHPAQAPGGLRPTPAAARSGPSVATTRGWRRPRRGGWRCRPGSSPSAPSRRRPSPRTAPSAPSIRSAASRCRRGRRRMT